MEENKKATIFIYVLVIVGVVLSLSVIILNNSISLKNSIDYQKIKMNLFSKIREKAETKSEHDILVNSDGTGFSDEFSCPDNITMSGTNIFSDGLKLTRSLSSDGKQYLCSGAYNEKVLNLFLNNNYNEFIKSKRGTEEINLIDNGGGDMVGQANFSEDNTLISFPASSYKKPDLVDDDFNSDDYSS